MSWDYSINIEHALSRGLFALPTQIRTEKHNPNAGHYFHHKQPPVPYTK